MTDKEILERAHKIMWKEGWCAVANQIEATASSLPGPPQPPGREVRIAVAINGRGGVYTADLDSRHCDANWPDDPCITHEAVITAVIPPVPVPVVAGKVVVS